MVEVAVVTPKERAPAEPSEVPMSVDDYRKVGPARIGW